MVDLYPIEDREGGVRRRELSGILAPSSGPKPGAKSNDSSRHVIE
jgi:hypothetical protein